MKNCWTRLLTGMAGAALLAGFNGCGSGLLAGVADGLAGPLAVSVNGPGIAATKRAGNSVTELSATVGQTIAMPLIATSALAGAPTIIAGSVPTGLALSSDGRLVGTPSAAGFWNFTVSGPAMEGQAPPVQKVAFTVRPAGIKITSGELAAGQSGSAYSVTLQAIGGTPGYTWSVASGKLPSGLSLSRPGTIAGTPTLAGSFEFVLRVSDSGAPVQHQTQKYTLAIKPASLGISSSPLPNAQVGAAYGSSLSATGGTPGYRWSVTSGSLPAGLVLSSAGAISGTPATAGTFAFTALVTDSGAPAQTQAQTFSLVVRPAALAITSSSIINAQAGAAYTSSLTATGGTPAYNWTLASGTLPAGLALGSSGTITGTPTVAGTASFTVALTDAGTPAQHQTQNLSLTVAPATLDITSNGLSTGQVGTAYSAGLTASGGTSGYVWSVASGSLPAGLTFTGAGVLSGTPTASGAFVFSIAVADGGSPAQHASKSFSVAIAPSPLTLTTVSLASAQSGAAYLVNLQAAGGTPAYAWSMAGGSLPAGLALSSAGVISGTPQAAGAASFTVAVSDSGTPALRQTANLNLTIAPSALGITGSSLGSGQVGTNYSASLSASGGTPSYTWSITSGALPAGLTLAATTGIISGKPTSSGTSNFAVAVADSSVPSQVQTVTTFLTITQAPIPPSAGNTWYVRPDGGTRYSAGVTTGQCDGKSDAPYPGSGVNQSCAFNDVRYFWTDGGYCVDNSSTSSCWKWIGGGGDTYLIRGSLASGITYRIGQSGPNSGDSFGLHGNPYGAGAPVPPSGTASAHTRILGENFASCSTQSAKTQLHGGYGVGEVLNLTGASYVDVACLDITDFSACGRSAQTLSCQSSYPLDDYATYGILFSNQTNHTTLTDLRVHGMASAGLIGPTGDGVVMTGLELIGNASSGWNADGGDGQTGTGSLLVQHFNISWNGCAEEYPIVDLLPYQDCTDDQSGGGYGDGFGTATVPSVPGWQAHFDQGVASYNTQDGLDALHLTGAGSSMSISRVLAYGNMGQQIKVGGAAGSAVNNVIFTNCNAMRQPIPGTPAGYNSRLSDFCRAADEGILFTVGKGTTSHFDFNTVYSASATGIDIQCDGSAGACDSTSTMTYRNNVFIGFMNDSSSGYPNGRGSGNFSNPIYLASFNPFANAGSSFTNNITYHAKSNWSCPATSFNESSGLCGDPLLTDESWHLFGFGDATPLLNNAVRGAGTAIPAVTTDYTGATRNPVPSIGAYE